MSVLNRRLFNRGGRVSSSRGVGITSGLVPSYAHGGLHEEAGGDVIKDRFKSNMEMFRELDLIPERQPFNKFQNIAPAALDFFGGLMSGKSMQGGLGGGLEIAGESLKSASPLFAEALKNKQEYDATDPEAGLKNMALELALKEGKEDKFNDPTEVVLEIKDPNDPSKVIQVNALRTFNEATNKFTYINPKDNSIFSDFSVLRPESDSTETAKSIQSGILTLNGKTYENASFIQQGKELFYMDPDPSSNTFGEFINTNELDSTDNLELTPDSVPKSILSVEEERQKLINEKNIDQKYKLAGSFLEAIQERNEGSAAKIKNYKIWETLSDEAGAGTAVGQRTGFLRALETLGINDAFPDEYAALQDILNVGNVPATEVTLSLAKKGTLDLATSWNQQINKGELGLLKDAGPQALLTPEGQKLLITINRLDQEINQQTAELLSDLMAKEGSDILEIHAEVSKFQDEKYAELVDLDTPLGKELKVELDKVLNFKNVKGADYFNKLEAIDLGEGGTMEKKEIIKAYGEKRIKFIGYPKVDRDAGTSAIVIRNNEGQDVSIDVFDSSLPVHAIEHDGDVYYIQF